MVKYVYVLKVDFHPKISDWQGVLNEVFHDQVFQSIFFLVLMMGLS